MQAQMEMQGMGMQEGGDAPNEFEVDVSNYSWDDIALPEGGPDEQGLEDEIKTYVEGPLENPELYEKVGRKPKGVVVHGKPGTGKTLLAKVVASESDATFLSASISELTSMFHGESSSQVDRLFDYAKEESPSIIYLDEADSLLRKRGGMSGSPTTDQIREDMVNTFLDNMDGIEELEDVMVIASTNRREAMDEAAVRDERFDAIFELPEPTEEARKKIFKIHTEQESPEAFGELDYDELAGLTEDWTGAQIAGAVERAKVNAIQELHEEYGEFGEIPPEELVIEHEDLLKTLDARQDGEGEGGLRYIS
ncbi:MAG: ATP-binding protein [Candidatus Nanohaloarchaea archaeon]|nr:ATP-binding protein [Candidatus Nanohaloarchaea archaeon]